MGRVATGLDLLVKNDFAPLRGARVGLLANQAAVDGKLRHAVDLLHAAKQCTLVRLFAPEHGFRGELQDMAGVQDGVDPGTGLPVISLYGSTEESLTPKKEQLDGIDVLVVDLPDIGSRYYTFAQSLGYAMGASSGRHTKILVLDRPNPINGAQTEGGVLEKECRSFCGYAPVPQRHGLTLGELALVMNKGFGTGSNAIPPHSCDLEVLRASGWKREMYFDETGLPWVIPSPNMPTLETAVVYPGACLFEATDLSEARGTTKPFELLGAPFIDGARWAEAVHGEGLELQGAMLRPLTFMPKFQKHANTICGGVQIHVTDRQSFKPLRWSMALLSSAARLYPDSFSWRNAAYEFVKSVPAIDLLYGSPKLRETITAGGRLDVLDRELTAYESWYGEARKEFLLY